jgi:hypothetical protein
MVPTCHITAQKAGLDSKSMTEPSEVCLRVQLPTQHRLAGQSHGVARTASMLHAPQVVWTVMISTIAYRITSRILR